MEYSLKVTIISAEENMSEHLSLDQIDKLRQRLMSTEELLSVDEHISGCEECRDKLFESEKFQTSISLWQDLLQSAEANHISFDQVKAYLENSLDEVDREIVESHLDLCPICKKVVEGMSSN